MGIRVCQRQTLVEMIYTEALFVGFVSGIEEGLVSLQAESGWTITVGNNTENER